MGILVAIAGGARHPLRAEHLIGRSTRTDLRIDDRSVSAEHATLRWTGRGWVLRDLGSRNGTWVDGHRVASGDSMALMEGDALSFGSAEPRFRLIETGPPCVS